MYSPTSAVYILSFDKKITKNEENSNNNCGTNLQWAMGPLALQRNIQYRTVNNKNEPNDDNGNLASFSLSDTARLS